MSKNEALKFITDYRDDILARTVDRISMAAFALVEARKRLEQARNNGADEQVLEDRWLEFHRTIGHLAGCMLETEKLIALADMIKVLDSEQGSDNH